MTELAQLLEGVRNYNVAVREYDTGDEHEEGIVFLHRIVEGAASKSYGIHVAKLAGVPRPVIARSREVLDELQRGFQREAKTPQLSRKKTKDADQMALFRDPGDELLDELRAINPDEVTPLDAIKHLIRWKSRFGP